MDEPVREWKPSDKVRLKETSAFYQRFKNQTGVVEEVERRPKHLPKPSPEILANLTVKVRFPSQPNLVCTPAKNLTSAT